MSRGRGTRHAGNLLACVLLMAMATGCRRSPFQRLPGPQSAGETQSAADPPEAEKVTVAYSTPASSSASVSTSMPQPQASSPTPLLDAALRRAEAQEREQERLCREARAAASLPVPRSAASTTPTPSTTRALSGPLEKLASPKAPQVVVVASEPKSAVAGSASGAPTPASPPAQKQSRSSAPTPAQATTPTADASLAWGANLATLKQIAQQSSREIRSAVLALDDLPPFGIKALRLCREVHGFGSFDPLLTDVIKVGQPVLLYSELAGLRYQAHDDGFTSRLSSKVELISASSGTKVWERELGEVEDQCRSRRRDNYVSTRIRVPSTVPPGSYRLRLSEIDLTAHQSTSAELPLSITR
ncbi:MAG: hypothetical protein ACLP7Q_21700 [Isosphaeraceae bacterium]